MPSEIQSLHSEMKAMRSDLEKRIDSVRSDLEKRIDPVRSEIEKRIDSVRSELSKRIDHLSDHSGELARGQGRLEGLLEAQGLLRARLRK